MNEVVTVTEMMVAVVVAEVVAVANKLALEHRLSGTNLWLGVQSSLAFTSVSSMLVRAIDVRQWSDGKISQLTLGNGRMAKQAKRSIVGMSIAIWWC